MFDAARTGTGTKEWAEVTENIQRGCQNDCLYCYAAHNASRFKMRERADWAREELTKRANITTYPAREGVVMFPSSHDITPFNVDDYIRVAKLILVKGNRLLIVTKPNRECMTKVMDELAEWKDQILFRFTIGAIDDDLVSYWEPGAPSSAERIDVLADAQKLGFASSVSIEPMLGGVEETLRVVKHVSVFDPQTIWIGKMNKVRLRVPKSMPRFLPSICEIETAQRDDEILRLYDLLKGDPTIRWKDSVKIVVAARDGI